MLNAEQIIEIVRNIKFDHHSSLTIKVHPDGNCFYLQLVDSQLPKEFNSGRKWRLSRHMCTSEIVSTAFAAYLAWIEHEARESFQYKNVSIYQPHYDVEALVDFAQDKSHNEYRT